MTKTKGRLMLKVLIPIDGSEIANHAVKLVIQKAPLYKEPLDIHLINVQRPFPGTIRGVRDEAKKFHRDEGVKALAGARALLDEAGVKYTFHIGVGDAAEVIARFVKEKQIDQVTMATRGAGAVANILMGSVSSRLLHLVDDVPVLLVK